MAHVVQENRQYRRILPSRESIDQLEQKGFEWVFSSNVSAIAKRGKDLIIRFHNGSIYRYSDQAKNYERMMAASSKGKWVWRHLIRPGVPYSKIGALPLAEDTTETDDEIGQPRIPTVEISVVAATEPGQLPQIQIRPLVRIDGRAADDGPPQRGVKTSPPVIKPKTLRETQENVTPQYTTYEGEPEVSEYLKKPELYKQVKDDWYNTEKYIKEFKFDEKPTVIKDKKKFEELAARRNITAFRGYAAKAESEAARYRQEMESGDFYIGGEGGSIYGRGMYTAYGKPGNAKAMKSALEEAQEYAKFDDSKFTSKIDTMTFTEDFNDVEKETIHDRFMRKTFDLIPNNLNDEDLKTAIEYLDYRVDAAERSVIDYHATPEEKMKGFQERGKLWRETKERYNSLPDTVKEAINAAAEETGDHDDSIKAIMMGYDGINVGELSYMIILNRKKVVLLGDDGDV